MAVVKEYERQFGANLSDFSGRRANAQDMGFAEGLSDLGRGIGQASMAFQKAEEDREMMDAQMKIAESDLQWSERIKSIRSSATPGVYTAPQVKSEMSEYFTKMAGNYKSESARRYVQMQGIRMTTNATQNSTVFDVDLAVKDKTVKRDNYSTIKKEQVYETPSRYEEAKADILFNSQNRLGIFSIPEGADARVALAMDQETKKVINQLAWSAGIGEVENNPVVRGSLAGMVKKTPVNLIDSVIKREGGFVADDAGKGNTKFGINQTAYPDVDVKNLTKEQAVQLYQQRYNSFGIGELPPEVQGVVFDGVVNHRIDFAKDLVKAAQNGASVNQLAQMRVDEYNRLINANPEKYGKYKTSWMNRVSESASEKIQEEKSVELPKSIKDAPWYEDLNPEQRVRLLNMAEQRQRKEQAVADRARDSAVKDQDAYFAKTLKMPDSVVNASAFTDIAERQAYESKLQAQMVVSGVADEPYDVQARAVEKLKPTYDSGVEPGVYAKQEMIYTQAQKILLEANKQRINDPIGIAYQRSFSTSNPIQPIEDFSDPAKIADVLKIRAPQAQAVNESYRTGKNWILMKNEAENVNRQFATMNYQARADYLDSIREGIGSDAYRAFVGQVWAGNKAVEAAGYMMDKAPDVTVKGMTGQAIAQTMLIGEQAMNRAVGKGDTDEEKAFQKALIPSKTEVRNLMGVTLKGVMIPPDAFDAISESVMAYYIGSKIRNEGGGTNTTISGSDSQAIANKKAFVEAIETVVGKPSEINGSNVLRPWGMTDGDFKDIAKTLVQQNHPGMENAGLLNVNGVGLYELVEGGIPTGKMIDVTKANANYGNEGRLAPILTPAQERVASAVKAQGGILSQISGGTLNKGGYGKPPTAQEVYAGVGLDMTGTGMSYQDVTKGAK